MTFSRTVWLSLIILIQALAAGIGYAVFVSEVSAMVTASAGSLKLEITSMRITSGPSYVILTPLQSLPSSNVAFKLGPLAPGDMVTLSSTTKNFGSLPATSIGDGFNTHSSLSCPASAALLTPLPSSLASSGTFATTIQVSAIGFGNNCQGATLLTFTLTFQGSIGT